MIGLGVSGVLLGIVGAVAAIAATGGAAAVAFAALGIYATVRGTLDTLKAIHDEFMAVEKLRKRVTGALTVFQQSKQLNGAKRTAEALANSVLKVGAIGFNLAGNPKLASLSDLNESVSLYEEKLCAIRSLSHKLSRDVGVLLGKMDSSAGAGEEVSRKAEAQLHKLLTKIPEFHTRCNNDLALLPDLKKAVQEVIQSKGKNFILLEKWLDFGINLTLSSLGGYSTIKGYCQGATTALDAAAGLAGGFGIPIDAISETDQLFSNASSRFERG
jgi:hypothetical protein